MLSTDTFCFFERSSLMIFVTSCGHDSHHPKPCDIEHKVGLPDYLILLIKKEAWIELDNQKQIIPPNSIICFPPNTYIHYGCDKIGYNDDWIHFYLDEKEQSFFQTLLLPMCTILHPYDFHKLSEYVRLMSDNYHSPSSYKNEITDSFMHIFLYSLQEELAKNNAPNIEKKYYHDFAKLRTQIYNNPAMPWTIPELASSLCLSLSYFQHLYKQFFSCSCQQDIIKARLELAKYYLTGSEICIHALADFCGYENELHFMRQFKKFVGMTPTEYRKCNQISPP